MSLEIAKASERVWYKGTSIEITNQRPSRRVLYTLGKLASYLSERSIKDVVDILCSNTILMNTGALKVCATYSTELVKTNLLILHINDTYNIHCYADNG